MGIKADLSDVLGSPVMHDKIDGPKAKLEQDIDKNGALI